VEKGLDGLMAIKLAPLAPFAS